MSNDVKTILYTGNFTFFPMNAAGKRVYANALLFRSLGYETVFLGVGNKLSTDDVFNCCSTERVFDGFKTYQYPQQLFLKNRYRYNLFFSEFKRFFETCLDQKPDFIITYSSPSLAMLNSKLLKFAKTEGVPIISDVADWHNVDSGGLLFRAVKQTDTNFRLAVLNKRYDGLIVISEWLREYYKSQTSNILLLPPLIPNKKNIAIIPNDVPQLGYAGIPFRVGAIIRDTSVLKDRIDIALKLLASVKGAGAVFVYHIYGITKDELLYSLPKTEKDVAILGDHVVFHGRRTMEEVQKALGNMDYTILIRHVDRFTSAGFPTKIVESISCAVPAITTKTSDIEKYLPEGKGAYYIDISNLDDSVHKLYDLLTRSTTERLNQKRICSQVDCFDTTTYTTIASDFLDDVSRR